MNLREISNTIDMPVNLSEAYEKAKKIQREERIHEDNKEFRDYYGNEIVDKDLKIVEDRENNFKKVSVPDEKKAKELATVAEVIVYQQSELANWFGEKVRTIKASNFDDWINGADFILEFEGDENSKESSGFHYLVVDVTFSQDIGKKLRGIKTGLHNHEMSQIKYFHTAYEDCKLNNNVKRLESVPRVVVALNLGVINELVNLWLNQPKGFDERLANHKAQLIILTEILDQLEAFGDYARQEDIDRGSNRNKDIIDKYKTMYYLLTDVFSKKVINLEEQGKALVSLEENSAYQSIKRYLESDFLKKGMF
jgi:hypothetical protein